MKPQLNGIIVIDKPAGLPSFGVVKAVRRVLSIKKIGHLGTLDPFATGVLPLCLNEATKLVPFLIEESKTYQAVLYLGQETDTQDLTGKVVFQTDELPDEAEIIRVIQTFAGEQFQVPPMYSAVHYQGKRLYQMARQGLAVEVPPRLIMVSDLKIEAIALPEVGLTVTCSKGTYIRTLATDIGRALGCGAHLKALQRLRVGPFSLDQAVALPVPEDNYGAAKLLAHLIPLSRAIPHFRSVKVGKYEAQKLKQGQRLSEWPSFPEEPPLQPGERVRVLQDQQLIAVAELSKESRAAELSPIRVFN
jgi:tRNA pseudouridine55 synthase